jgi:hypothetical protein
MPENFEVIELDNFKFSLEELEHYYHTVQSNFSYLKWAPDADTDTKDHNVSEVYGWAIQSNLKDPKKPCSPYDISKGDDVVGTFDVPTELIFGFAEKFLKALPFVRQTVITAHPPETKINLHSDNEEFYKIHMPITANNESMFNFEGKEYNLQPGKAYLINTEKLHGTFNKGETTRVHFITKLRIEDMNKVVNNEYTI